MLVPCGAFADQFTGKVVGINDGDPLSVLHEGKDVKARLHGVDTPESKQAFGTRAKQFTSEPAFNQPITVIVKATDQYGRLVGEVLLPDGGSLNQELVKAGVKPKVTRPVSMLEMLMQPAPEMCRCIALRMPVESAHQGHHVVVRCCTPLASDRYCAWLPALTYTASDADSHRERPRESSRSARSATDSQDQ
jgi:hypothetical protein